jgi:hypothetical protein
MNEGKLLSLVWNAIFIALGLTALPNPALQAANTISGRVTNAATGSAVQAADIDVFNTADNLSVPITALDGSPAMTDSTGAFTVQLPGPGQYILRIDLDATAPLADRYYGGAFLKSSATPINVTSGQDVTEINIQLLPGYPISGSVKGNGAPLPNVDLDVYEAVTGEFLGNYPGASDASGNFVLGAFPSGSYLIRADPDPLLGQLFVSEFYGGSVEKATGFPVAISTEPVTGITIDLEPGGTIEGQISSGSTGQLLENIDLDIYYLGGARAPFNAKSALDGTFAIGPMPPGDYVIRADPNATQGHAVAYYEANGTLPLLESLATPITVTAGQRSVNHNFALRPGANITGTILSSSNNPLDGVDLDLYDSAGSRLHLTARSMLNGTFSIGPLPAGEYYLKADPTLVQGYAPAYYSLLAAAPLDPAIASPIRLGSGIDSTGIQFNLLPGGAIAGTIRDDRGNILSGVDLDLYDSLGNRINADSSSSTDGSYLIGPVPVGQYIIRADPLPTSGRLLLYYPDNTEKLMATLVQVSASLTTANIDFSLPAAGWISGTVLSQVGGLPLAGIDIDIFDATTGLRVSGDATTDISGNYIFGPLAPGNFLVRCDPTIDQTYSVEYYNGTWTKASANGVSVIGGAGTTADFSLDRGGSISGTVLDRLTGSAIANVDIDVLVAATGEKMDQGAISDALGNWTVGPLPVGTYIIRVDSAPGSPLADVFSGEARTLADATSHFISAGSTLQIGSLRMPPDLVVPIIQLAPTGTDWNVLFEGTLGLKYYLERSSNLDPLSWEPLGSSGVNGITGTLSVPIPPNYLYSNGATFFRVRID